MSLLAITKACGPGRPKDLEKRAAILDAAKHLFIKQGFEGTSMDAIANKAAVSKLTVYSHYRDKETLFAAAVSAKCEEQMPPEIFNADLKGPIRSQLLTIARAFFGLIMAEDAIAIHRTIVANAQSTPKLARLFWEAGPMRLHDAFAEFLRDEVGGGKLEIADIDRATSQFFCLLKGDCHARQEFGLSEPMSKSDIDQHLNATVDLFLRAYAPR
jgi:TetR/AcrR family transcriptional regulator, mexJK operon transcriptional repressor